MVSNIESAYTFEQYVEDNWQQMILAKAKDEVIGVAYWNESEILGLGILPSWWRRGVGRNLMEHVERAMRDQHLQTARLEVYEVNHSAVQFYEVLGYTVANSFVTEDWAAPVTTLVMTKTL